MAALDFVLFEGAAERYENVVNGFYRRVPGVFVLHAAVDLLDLSDLAEVGNLSRLVLLRFDLYFLCVLLSFLNLFFTDHLQEGAFFHFSQILDALSRGCLDTFQPRLYGLLQAGGVVRFAPIVKLLSAKCLQLLVNEPWNMLVLAVIRAPQPQNSVKHMRELVRDLALSEQISLSPQEPEEFLAVLRTVSISRGAGDDETDFDRGLVLQFKRQLILWRLLAFFMQGIQFEALHILEDAVILLVRLYVFKEVFRNLLTVACFRGVENERLDGDFLGSRRGCTMLLLFLWLAVHLKNICEKR